MTTEPTLQDELRVRRGRLAALDVAAKIRWGLPDEADRIHQYEKRQGTEDDLLAGAVAMFLTVVRGYAELTDSQPEEVIDHLWQTEAGAMVTLADIDKLTTTDEEDPK